MKFTILSILGISAFFRISGVSADCCQIFGTTCPAGYGLADINFGGNNNVCSVKNDLGGVAPCDIVDSSTMPICSGGDVPTPTPPVPAPPASSGCCQTPGGSCPAGYGLVGEIDGNTVCGIKIDGTSTCTANIDLSLPFCSDDVPSPTPGNTATDAPTPLSTSEATTPVPAPTPSSDCCMIPDGTSCPSGYELADITIGSNTVCGIPIDGGGFNCDGFEFTSDNGTMKTCSGGDEPKPTPPSPTPPSSAGKIGMNAWFVAAAAAAFAEIN